MFHSMVPEATEPYGQRGAAELGRRKAPFEVGDTSKTTGGYLSVCPARSRVCFSSFRCHWAPARIHARFHTGSGECYGPLRDRAGPAAVSTATHARAPSLASFEGPLLTPGVRPRSCLR